MPAPRKPPRSPPRGEGEPRFIVDTMLGDLAKWLRILGYDAYYSSRLEDWEILRRAEREGRIILTMDKGLASRARRRGLRVVRITSFGATDRLAELAMRLPIRLEADPSRSRCPECGGPLRLVTDKKLLAGRVPPAALEAYDRFYVCERCGRVYWEGSHWVNIRRVLREARERLARARESGETGSEKRSPLS